MYGECIFGKTEWMTTGWSVDNWRTNRITGEATSHPPWPEYSGQRGSPATAGHWPSAHSAPGLGCSADWTLIWWLDWVTGREWRLLPRASGPSPLQTTTLYVGLGSFTIVSISYEWIMSESVITNYIKGDISITTTVTDSYHNGVMQWL